MPTRYTSCPLCEATCGVAVEVQGEFVKKAQPIIQAIAQEKGLQVLFNGSEAGFAWADPSLDLTAEVIKRLDSGKASAPKN